MTVGDIAALLEREGTTASWSIALPGRVLILPRRGDAVRIGAHQVAQLVEAGALRIEGERIDVDADRCAELAGARVVSLPLASVRAALVEAYEAGRRGDGPAALARIEGERVPCRGFS